MMQTLFNMLDLFIARFSLLNRVLDFVATKVVPQQSAGACGSDYIICGARCSKVSGYKYLCTVGCGCSLIGCSC